jgi:hypothetical protein
MNLARLSPKDLLQLHARIGEELRARGIIRSANNPTGDLAEHLFCKAFGWKQSGNSNPNIDAISHPARDVRPAPEPGPPRRQCKRSLTFVIVNDR